MIFKFLKGGVSGGGKARRWFKFQQSMSKKRWFELDREKNGPIALFDFSDFNDAVDAALIDEGPKKGGWRISDDSTIGGYSKGKFQLIRNPQDYQQVMQGKEAGSLLEAMEKGEINEKDYNDTYKSDDKVNDDDAESVEEEITVSDHGDDTQTKKKFIPFVRWNGTIDTRIDENSEVQRSGFCAIRSPEFPFGGADLGGRYNALEILCRSDGRPYSLNLKVDTFIPEDIFQTFINVPPTYEPDATICPETGGKFDRVVLLFQHFIVTAGGRMRSTQRDLDNSVRIETIGLTLMDGVDGDFQFDLARIRAVNYDERGIIYNKAKVPQ
ncbi:unnamed protein product [Cylindrotheca closterium]|uniref:NADH:ubiquinone oxidoreductase intermediate-associated protein 30 domain-containing protein n=1 Tax=Cylindrotheca closterium TaxID=2856 RepID=A0AAD2CJV2_9STRA|nr:unnamed protein product [Cylindrotheca closterium]